MRLEMVDVSKSPVLGGEAKDVLLIKFCVCVVVEIVEQQGVVW